MAKRKPKGDPADMTPATEASTRKPNRTGLSLHVYLRPQLRRVIEQAADRNRRSLTEEVSIALERYLQSEGLWPPSDQPS